MTARSRPVSTLLTDLYQLTMIAAYFELNMDREAVFEFFARRLPAQRGFLMVAGLEQVVEYLENLRFEPQDVEWLASTGRFTQAALDRMAALRFTGKVDAMPEGSVCFANEPILRVTAPLPEAQIVESRVINLLNYQTTIASKAARCRLAAGSRQLADFGMRRAHGAEAALYAARASFIAGFDSTATVEAGRAFGLPLTGTMAHSFIQAHADELGAFRDFARCHPRGVTLLIDTYDTVNGAKRAVELHREGVAIAAVRLDSGDLDSLSRAVRKVLDEGGCRHVHIVASGNVDEFSIHELARAGAPIDGFGIGTKLAVSADAPYLDCVYKLQVYDGRPRRKKSAHKETWPGSKQVYRSYVDGRIAADVIGLVDEPIAGRPLLEPVMRDGRLVEPGPGLDVIRQRAARELSTLAEACRAIREPSPIIASISADVRRLAAEADAAIH